jgi:hypothetical protein
MRGQDMISSIAKIVLGQKIDRPSSVRSTRGSGMGAAPEPSL